MTDQSSTSKKTIRIQLFKEMQEKEVETATSRDGTEFRLDEGEWHFRDAVQTVCINFKLLHNFSREMLTFVKKVLLMYVENKSAAYVVGIFSRIVKLHNYLSEINPNKAIAGLSHSDLINFKEHDSIKNALCLGYISSFLKKWYLLGYPGISKEANTYLSSIRLKGNQKGEPVLTFDADSGPLTELELQATNAALNQAYSKGLIAVDAYLLVMLCMLLGQRPIQYAALKIKDFTVLHGEGNKQVYLLNIPRAKQRGSAIRQSFTQRKIIPEIGAIFENYVESLKAYFTDKVENVLEAPIFYSKHKHNSQTSPTESFKFHLTTASASDLIQKTCAKIAPISERTGKPINLTAVRFRRTLGTRAAMEGHGVLYIAELLDHSDIQNVGVYVECRPEILDRIDKAMALQLAPLAQAFAGVIIKDESKASLPGNKISCVTEGKIKTAGNCGTNGYCGLMAPIACYTCASFEPWLDGPHDKVLEFLISERERLSKDADLRIASVNDRTILAVADVVKRCEDLKNGTAS